MPAEMQIDFAVNILNRGKLPSVMRIVISINDSPNALNSPNSAISRQCAVNPRDTVLHEVGRCQRTAMLAVPAGRRSDLSGLIASPGMGGSSKI